MALPAYITMEGEIQGEISQGAGTFDSITNETQQGHEDEIMAHAIDHSVITPRDPLSGNPTGMRIHNPFIITCGLNKAVPLMYNALSRSELLTAVEIKWYRTQGAEQVHFFTTKLEDALIVDINSHMPHVKDDTKKEITQLIDVKMTYRKISWDHLAAGTSATDDWKNPLQS